MKTPLLLEIFDLIGKKISRNNFSVREKKVNDELKAEIKILSENELDLKNIVDHLFTKRNKNPDQYFEVINEIQAYLNFDNSSILLSGSVFLYWLKNMKETERNELFNKLKDINNFHIWDVIRILPIVLSKYEMEPVFASNWFLEVGESIKHDLASGSFFEAIDNYATAFPNSAFKIVETYISEEFRELRLEIASIIVGSLRCHRSFISFQINKKNIDDYFSSHYHERFRILYYKSLITSYSKRKYSVEEIISKIEVAIHGKPGEIEEAYHIANRILLHDIANDQIVLLILNWYSSNSNESLSNLSKFYISNSLSLWSNTSKTNNYEYIVIQGVEIFKKILPVPLDNRGTWKEIDRFLYAIVKKCPNQIISSLSNINNCALNIFLQLIEEDQFDSFINCLVGEVANTTIFALLFSQNQTNRSLAYTLMRKKKRLVVQPNNNAQINDIILEQILDEFSSQIFLGEETALFFQSMEPLFNNVNDNLKNKFIREMTFQAVNYPGACLNQWKKNEPKTDTLKKVIANADRYFENLKEVDELPAINFKCFEIEKAVALEMRIKSRNLNKSVREKSIFYSLAKHIQILYGRKWTIQNSTFEDAPRDMNVISHTVEFPRIEFIDPEGIFLRRFYKRARGDNE